MRKIVYTYQVCWWMGTHHAPGAIFATLREAMGSLRGLGDMSNVCINKIPPVVGG